MHLSKGFDMVDATELLEIGRRHGSDKWTGHHYAEPYARHLSRYRNRAIDLLEIGIGGYDNPHEGGSSLRAWRDYFPDAMIAGLDFYDKSPHRESRIRTYKGSQTDPRVIAAILADCAAFDVIIDDGSHRSEHITSTFYMLWQFLKPGGVYVIEDLQTSYWPNHGGKLYEVNSPLTAMGFLKSLVDGLNWEERHQPCYTPSSFETEITGIHFYHNLVFIDCGENREGSTEVVGNRITGV